MGWAVIDKDGHDYRYIFSSYEGVVRQEKEAYQLYRRRLIEHWTVRFHVLLDTYTPDSIVYEILPAASGDNFVVATQAELAKTVLTVCEVKAMDRQLDF